MNAVNMAPIPKSVAAVIQPYFGLAERMGTIAIYLANGPVKEVEIEYSGELSGTETQHLSTAFLKGLLNPILQDSVNYVNAPGLAKKRNIDVKESKSHKSGYYTTAITARIKPPTVSTRSLAPSSTASCQRSCRSTSTASTSRRKAISFSCHTLTSQT